MNTSDVTHRTDTRYVFQEAQTLTLRLREPPEPIQDRAAVLLQEMENSDLLTDEERSDLVEAQQYLENDHARWLGIIQIQVIQGAITRRLEHDLELEELPDWKKRMEELILEVLPEGVSLQRHLSSLKTMMVAMCRLQEARIGIHRQSNANLDRLSSRFNTLNLANNQGDAATRAGLSALRESRMQSIDRLTSQVSGRTETELSIAQSLIKLTNDSQASFSRSTVNIKAQLNTLEQFSKTTG